MNNKSALNPVIIAVGQITHRNKIDNNGPFALDLAKQAVEACAQDSKVPGILSRVDRLCLVNAMSEAGERPAERLCHMLEITPAVQEYSSMGGNSPQWLINRAADRIVREKAGVVLIAGAEALYRTKEAAVVLSARELEHRQVDQPGIIGDVRLPLTPCECLHGADQPTSVYPLFENALRADQAWTMDRHQRHLAEHLAAMSRIAAENPLAWFRNVRTRRQTATVDEDNRMICFPYTKLMNPVLPVNQAAAILITSAGTAEQLGIPQDRWVYLHGGWDARDKWFVSERINYVSSPAMQAVRRSCLGMAGLEMQDIDFFDLYSCFPCATMIAAREMGFETDPLPALTITGGLACFGGPGNNYALHAVAHAVERIRRAPEQTGYVTGIGWYMTKHSAGIYSGRRPRSLWNRDGQEEIQQQINAMAGPQLDLTPRGPATVETYTVVHDRQGLPQYAVIIARLENGARCWAQTEPDPDLFREMETEEFIGKTGTVRSGDPAANIMRF